MEIRSTYEEALRELRSIVEQLQNNAISIDDLSAKVKRANALIRFCKEKLRSTEADIQELFNNNLS